MDRKEQIMRIEGELNWLTIVLLPTMSGLGFCCLNLSYRCCHIANFMASTIVLINKPLKTDGF